MSTLTDQEKAALLVLLGKSTGAGKGFTEKELRIILLIADGMFKSIYHGLSAERLAADIQNEKDQAAEDAQAMMDMEAKRNAKEFETRLQEQFPDNEPPTLPEEQIIGHGVPPQPDPELLTQALELLVDVLKGTKQ